MTTLQLPNVLDLRSDFPRSPNDLLGGYVILARTIDKCRAGIAGMAGEYHWNCGLAKAFFDYKAIDPMAFYDVVKAGKSDEEILAWVETTGNPKTEEETLAWAYDRKWARPETPEMKAYVEGTVRSLNLKTPYIASFFQMLDAEEGRYTP